MKVYQNLDMEAGCPICADSHGLLLYRATSAEAAQHFVLEQVEPLQYGALRQHIEMLWAQTDCAVVRCRNCDFVYSFPYVAGDARFYALAFSGEGYPRWKWEFAVTRDTIVRKFGRDFTLLEIGAGNGAFVRELAPALTPKEKIVCTEYSLPGRRAMLKQGLNVLDSDVRSWDAEAYRQYFDVVCMFQVLEHTGQLDDFFACLNRITSPRASFFAAVPNGEHIEFNELHGVLLDMPPNHIGRWNKRCFAEWALRHGWRMTEYQIAPRPSARTATRQFCIYRYLFQSHTPTSLANRLERIRFKPLRRVGQVFGIGYYALLMPGELVQLWRHRAGNSQWVHLEKMSAH